jgi:hypothetical protein
VFIYVQQGGIGDGIYSPKENLGPGGGP